MSGAERISAVCRPFSFHFVIMPFFVDIDADEAFSLQSAWNRHSDRGCATPEVRDRLAAGVLDLQLIAHFLGILFDFFGDDADGFLLLGNGRRRLVIQLDLADIRLDGEARIGLFGDVLDRLRRQRDLRSFDVWHPPHFLFLTQYRSRCR